MNNNDLITRILERNRNLHDRHRGERCFILGCGPSISRQDLRPLRDECSIAVSNFFVHPHFKIISPRYYCVAPHHPPISEEAWQEWLKELDGATPEIAMILGLSDAERNLSGGCFSGRDLFFLHFGGTIETMLRDGIDLASPLPAPQSVSIMALTAALAMGFSEIYLLGCDHDWLIHMYQSRHFYQEDKHAFTRVDKRNTEWDNSDLEDQCRCYINLWRQYKALRQVAERSGISIFNATDGGMLDVFPRVELQSLFKDNYAPPSLTTSGAENMSDDISSRQPTEYQELTRVTPVSRQFGFDRGLPIDRYYIEKFLAANRHFIRGSVLEAGDATYTRSFGTGVTASHVLSAVAEPGVTIVGDLATGDNIPESTFDCIILTQTIQMIYDVRSALANTVKALKPEGVLLLTASGISQISRYDMDRWGEFWRFTDRSLKTLLEECAPEGSLHVETHGNVAVAKAFLDGRALGEIPEETLEYRDEDYQVLVCARVEKRAATGQVDYRARRESVRPPVVLLYHRVADDPIDSQLLAVSPKNFEEQLSVLAASYRVAPLRQLLEKAGGGPLPDGTVAITFDDGYRDNLVNALPILERFGMHATIFVTSGMIGADEEFWWDAVENIFLTGRPLPDSLRIHVNDVTKVWPLTSAKERLLAHDEICSILRSLPPNQIRQAVEGLFGWAGADPRPRPSHLTLNRDELRLLAASPGIEIGSHTISHGRLSPLSSSEEFHEMLTSKRTLEEITGKTVDIVSYPFGSAGDFSRQTTESAATAGYRFGIANIQADLHTPLDPFAVPRRLVRNWSGNEFSAWLESPAKDRLEAYTMEKRNLRLSGGVPA
jgi:peptidoglycan/xylan/chitin deacetylase (PgdA/CDA1 family)